ncbi:MAG: hypothetical protein N2234_02500 [Planctomycetota bacterium]|nr:hypothetical protein [Planctomycetota bacterium]
MKNFKTLLVVFCVLIAGLTFLLADEEVRGFSGIPVYPGASSPEKNPEAGEGKYYEGTDEDGCYFIWYRFDEKLQKEWDENAESVSKKIINFYKEELKKRGWEYVGEGVGCHFWCKDKNGIAICIPCDYEIEYTRMTSEDAKANTIKLEEKEFVKAYMDCIKAAQRVYEKKYGIKTTDDYAKKASEIMQKGEEGLKELEKLESDIMKDVKKEVKEVLKGYKISLERLKELKKEYEESLNKYWGENQEEVNQNLLGMLAMDRL